MKIGFVTLWFERGQAYITRALREALIEGGHECHILARPGEMDGKRELERRGGWAVPNLTEASAYLISAEAMERWVEGSGLDWVIFNEEHDWRLVRVARSVGARVATYLDYYASEWGDLMPLYHSILCSSERSYGVVKHIPGAHFIGWGLRAGAYPQASYRYEFFHNAGWLGINYRKGTPEVIQAFLQIESDAQLYIHAQASKSKMPSGLRGKAKGIKWVQKTVGPPGLYHLGGVHVYPSKVEGLGLGLIEGLASGLCTITTDAAPMNEFIEHGENGLLLDVVGRSQRQDKLAFPENHISVDQLASYMAECLGDRGRVVAMGLRARERALEQFAWGAFVERVNQCVH